MTNACLNFLQQSLEKAFDKDHRCRLEHNIGKYDVAVVRGKQQYRDLELAKRRAANLKDKVIQKLDVYLAEFEKNLNARGGKVIWCSTTRDAQREIMQLVRKARAKVVVKQKTMVSEELELNSLFARQKREVFETDLGEYIVQIAGEKPYHILTPAMHKSKEDVAELFHRKFNLPEHSTPAEIAAFVRQQLRKEYIRADVGITGANFLVADSGAIGLTENEGNGILTMAFPAMHIVLAGIEKLIPSLEDLDLLFPLLATHGTGQYLTVYNNLVFGPRQPQEPDGPDQLVVILIDNGRSELLSYPAQRKALWCIRCGACLNACPVYKSVGGYTYGVEYSGPVGSVISPYYKGFKEFNHLSFASTLCGRCTEVCPVKIPLHELLLQNRNEAVKRKLTDRSWNRLIRRWSYMMLHRWTLDKPGPVLKNAALRYTGKRKWGPRRKLPVFPAKTFKELWHEQQALQENKQI